MTLHDPIADMCTRIRNAIMAGHEIVEIPASRIKVDITRVLKREGYIRDFKFIEDGKQGLIKIYLKRDDRGDYVIHTIDRVSKPGLRVYVKKHAIPLVKRGLGIAILSTSVGVITGRDAFQKGVGGEYLIKVF